MTPTGDELPPDEVLQDQARALHRRGGRHSCNVSETAAGDEDEEDDVSVKRGYLGL